MTQRSVEIVIGKLVSDESLRDRFRRGALVAIAQLRREGIELNAVESAALAALDANELDRLARTLDERLQRASLAPERRKRRGLGLLLL